MLAGLGAIGASPVNGLPVLTFHAIDDSGDVTATSLRWLVRTLESLASEGFACVDLEGWVAAGRPRVDRAYALTFDDGFVSIRGAAEPMARLGLTATVFLVTGSMGRRAGWAGSGGRSVMSWDVTKDLAGAGFRFGAHTRTHPRLGRCSRGLLAGEIVDSRGEIEDRIGEPCPLFAYPYGDAPKAARTTVARAFAAGFGTRLDVSDPDEDRACLSRIDAYYLRSPRALRAFLEGRSAGRFRLRRAARAARRAFAVA